MRHELIDRLPNYIEDDGENKYFLNISKDLDGRWSAAYVLYREPEAPDLTMFWINDADNLNEVYKRLGAMLERRGYSHA